jgi:hypothetical protein
VKKKVKAPAQTRKIDSHRVSIIFFTYEYITCRP